MHFLASGAFVSRCIIRICDSWTRGRGEDEKYNNNNNNNNNTAAAPSAIQPYRRREQLCHATFQNAMGGAGPVSHPGRVNEREGCGMGRLPYYS